MRYVFGPVPSRRLGRSLGIDPIPHKICNWNCVYCQLGRTRPLVNERKEYIPSEEILAEVRDVLENHAPGEIDWVTFVGSGEPLLHARIGYLIRQVKDMTELPVAVISNGSLLYLADVRQEIAAADAVLPSLDAGTADLYRKINRPHPDITFEKLVQGLIAFREEYQGQLWIEVMLIRGLNDTSQALAEIASVLNQIEPDSIHINSPTRPPAETWVGPADEQSLRKAVEILGEAADVVNPVEGSFGIGKDEDPIDAIVGIIGRHPMRLEDIERAVVRWSSEEIRMALENLKNSGRVKMVERFGIRFWCPASSQFPDDARSQRTMPGMRDRTK
jgi:wyosine [tRNA(Phe)-imidazoG37] synthetase (radical SAM superfamily)